MDNGTHLGALVDTLDNAWQGGFTARSDWHRENAEVVAMATERGLITTRVGPNMYGNKHLITPKGLDVLFNLKGITQ